MPGLVRGASAKTGGGVVRSFRFSIRQRFGCSRRQPHFGTGGRASTVARYREAVPVARNLRIRKITCADTGIPESALAPDDSLTWFFGEKGSRFVCKAPPTLSKLPNSALSYHGGRRPMLNRADAQMFGWGSTTRTRQPARLRLPLSPTSRRPGLFRDARLSARAGPCRRRLGGRPSRRWQFSTENDH